MQNAKLRFQEGRYRQCREKKSHSDNNQPMLTRKADRPVWRHASVYVRSETKVSETSAVVDERRVILLVANRHNGIDGGGPASRNQTGDETDHDEAHRCHPQNEWIVRG